jgi:hypothetical protein
MERVDRQERTGASWRDLESARVIAQRHEFITVDFINEDASVGEFLDPNVWTMQSVRLPFDHTPGRKGILIRLDGEWVALHHMGLDATSIEAEIGGKANG